MKQLIGLILLVTFPAFAQTLTPRSPEETSDAFLKSLSKKCSDGIGYACYTYGLHLQQARDPKKRSQGGVLIRRACTLAYAPACTQRSTATASKNESVNGGSLCGNPQAFAGTSFDANKLTKVNPALQKAGMKPGDIIKSINGRPITSPEQLTEALKNGSAEVQIERDGTPVTVDFKCD